MAVVLFDLKSASLSWDQPVIVIHFNYGILRPPSHVLLFVFILYGPMAEISGTATVVSILLLGHLMLMLLLLLAYSHHTSTRHA